MFSKGAVSERGLLQAEIARMGADLKLLQTEAEYEVNRVLYYQAGGLLAELILSSH